MKKAAIVIRLVQQKTLSNLHVLALNSYSCSASVLNYDVHIATEHDSKLCAKKILKTKSLVERALYIGQFEASTSPLAYPGCLIPLSSRWGGNLIIRVFREVRNFDPHAQGVGYFNRTLDLISFWSFRKFRFVVLGFRTCHKVLLQSFLYNKK